MCPCFKVDLGKKEEIDDLWRKLEGKEPDVLVNNAGIYPLKDFLQLDESFLARVMNINLNSDALDVSAHDQEQRKAWRSDH